MNCRILFLVPSDYESLQQKGTLHMIFDRDEGGFFERVVTVHPIAKKTRIIQLNETHVVHEIGFDIIAGFERYRILRYFQAPFHFFQVLYRVVSLIKHENIHIIRANDPYWMGFVGLIASRFTSVPLCVSIHSDYDKRFQLDELKGAPTVFGSRKLAKYLEHFVLSRAKIVMPIRDSLMQQAVLNGANPRSIRTIPHGIDMTPFQQPAEFNIYDRFKLTQDLMVLSFVGRLSKENYVDDILELARVLGSRRNDFVIVMAGGGNEEERLRGVIIEESVLKRVIRLVGFQPHEVCLDLRRSSTVSLCLMAGFSLIEACAAGSPVVSYDVEWHYEFVKNNETGFLVKEHDIGGLVSAVSFLMDHPEEAHIMGEKAQALAFEKHEIKKTSEIKKMCYEELLRKNVNEWQL